MKVIFAKNIGFCPGVKRAVRIAKTSLKQDPKPVQFLGELVHNEKVMEIIEKNGGKILHNTNEIEKGTLIIRAHGEIIDFKKIKKEVVVRDATCPLVKKAHRSAENLLKNGYFVIIIGDKNHPETKGINNSIKNKGIIIEKESEAKKLPKFKKIGVVSQTTQTQDFVNKILKILKHKTKELKFINTICPGVAQRQKELANILQSSDGILVIGSSTSANTSRLLKAAKENKKPALRVNSLTELKNIKFPKIKRLGVVSGTSTPDWEINKIKKWLQKDVKQK